jgi:hypothetical protein
LSSGISRDLLALMLLESDLIFHTNDVQEFLKAIRSAVANYLATPQSIENSLTLDSLIKRTPFYLNEIKP